MQRIKQTSEVTLREGYLVDMFVLCMEWMNGSRAEYTLMAHTDEASFTDIWTEKSNII